MVAHLESSFKGPVVWFELCFLNHVLYCALRLNRNLLLAVAPSVRSHWDFFSHLVVLLGLIASLSIKWAALVETVWSIDRLNSLIGVEQRVRL